MATQVQRKPESGKVSDTAQKLERARGSLADAPEMTKTALENLIRAAKENPSARSEPATPVGSAGRKGLAQGKVAEFTIIAPFAKGGAERLRAILQSLAGFELAEKVGTVHDMRFVFLDNDTKLLFATAYDGDWDKYISDFATTIPDALDLLFSNLEGYPGIRHSSIKDYLLKYQIPAEAWYVANPDLTVVETRRLQRIGKALDEFLDKVGQ